GSSMPIPSRRRQRNCSHASDRRNDGATGGTKTGRAAVGREHAEGCETSGKSRSAADSCLTRRPRDAAMLATVPLRWIATAALLVTVSLAGGRHAAAQPRADEDFATEGAGWRSVSRLMAIARERSEHVEVADRLDIGTLSPNDALLILHPREPLPSGPLTEFLRSGGRVVLADDFGAGDSLLATFQIGRASPNADRALALRGNP